MKTGLKEAIERTKSAPDIILFLDADIRNLTLEWIDKLVKSLIDDNCDMSRGFYTRHARDAAVTKLIARPMLHIYFPNYPILNIRIYNHQPTISTTISFLYFDQGGYRYRQT